MRNQPAATHNGSPITGTHANSRSGSPTLVLGLLRADGSLWIIQSGDTISPSPSPTPMNSCHLKYCQPLRLLKDPTEDFDFAWLMRLTRLLNFPAIWWKTETHSKTGPTGNSLLQSSQSIHWEEGTPAR